jgi:predicted RNA-binding protein with PUA domain
MSLAGLIFRSSVSGWVSDVPLVRNVCPPLVQDHGPRGEGDSTEGTQASFGNADELRVGDPEDVAVIAEDGEVGAAHDVLGMLLLLNLVPGDAHNVIVFQGELHRLREGNAASSRRFGFLGGQGHGEKRRQESAKENGA